MPDTLIIGAGPAGLAAGYHLARRNLNPIVIEKDSQAGGLSKTLEYKGYRFDIGGHRFFTDNKEVERLWFEVLGNAFIKKHRLSRIYYRNKFFDYPLHFTNAFKNLGLRDSFLILTSYLKASFIKEEEVVSFEDYIVRRFGRRLFEIFFKEYTEKVWGIPCSRLSADWAGQRIAGLSIMSVIKNSLQLGQGDSVRTLVKNFYYPILGPGMMYEEMARSIAAAGGKVELGREVIKVSHKGDRITEVAARLGDNSIASYKIDSLISSMPLNAFISAMEPAPPQEVLDASSRLKFRSILVANLICRNPDIFPDNWIYIHSPDIKLCRIQNYKNWSSLMVPDARHSSLGLEYFCSEADELWGMKDEDVVEFAKRELEHIGFKVNVIDFCVHRASAAYPVYFVGYKDPLKVIEEYLASFTNLQIAGRAGQYRYDNMDAAISTGISAAKNIIRII